MNRVKALLSAWPLDRKTSLTLAVVTVLLVSIDFFNRIWVPRGAGERGFEPPSLVVLNAASNPEQALEAMRSWLPPALGGSGVVEKQLYLVGVLGSTSNPVAVLGVGARGPGSRYVKVRVGESVESWTVDGVTRRTVSVSRGSEKKTLEIFPRPIGLSE
jgi:hypothetical protein